MVEAKHSLRLLKLIGFALFVARVHSFVLLSSLIESIEVSLADGQQLVIGHVHQHECSELLGLGEVGRDRAELYSEELRSPVGNEALRDECPPVGRVPKPLDALCELE